MRELEDVQVERNVVKDSEECTSRACSFALSLEIVCSFVGDELCNTCDCWNAEILEAWNARRYGGIIYKYIYIYIKYFFPYPY